MMTAVTFGREPGLTMQAWKEPAAASITPLDVGEFMRDRSELLRTFRHVLSVNGKELIQVIGMALGTPVGLLGYSPIFDTDGELYTGGANQTADWYRQAWSMPGNQEHAYRFSYPPNDEERHFMIPVDGYVGFDDYDPYRKSPHAHSRDEGTEILWAIENRHRTPWMIVPLQSHRFWPFLFVSQNPEKIQTVTRMVIENSPSALISVWNGPETAGTG
jgi:hypothetical protein